MFGGYAVSEMEMNLSEKNNDVLTTYLPDMYIIIYFFENKDGKN